MQDQALTVQKLIDILTAAVQASPEVAGYQLAQHDYDDFAVGYSGYTDPCTEVYIKDLPVTEDDEFVHPDLTSSKIVMIR